MVFMHLGRVNRDDNTGEEVVLGGGLVLCSCTSYFELCALRFVLEGHTLSLVRCCLVLSRHRTKVQSSKYKEQSSKYEAPGTKHQKTRALQLFPEPANRSSGKINPDTLHLSVEI